LPRQKALAADECGRWLGAREREIRQRHRTGRWALLPCAAVPVASLLLSTLAVLQVLLGIALCALVLMHSGRDTGFGGMGFTPQSHGGTHIVERNLTRLTLVVAALFFINSIVLFRQLK
jgi:preprotein translocase subunit SecG